MRSTSSYGATGVMSPVFVHQQLARRRAGGRDADRREQVAHDRDVGDVGHVGEVDTCRRRAASRPSASAPSSSRRERRPHPGAGPSGAPRPPRRRGVDRLPAGRGDGSDRAGSATWLTSMPGITVGTCSGPPAESFARGRPPNSSTPGVPATTWSPSESSPIASTTAPCWNSSRPRVRSRSTDAPSRSRDGRVVDTTTLSPRHPVVRVALPVARPGVVEAPLGRHRRTARRGRRPIGSNRDTCSSSACSRPRRCRRRS